MPTPSALSEYKKLKKQLAEYDASLNELKKHESVIGGFLNKSRELLKLKEPILTLLIAGSDQLKGLEDQRRTLQSKVSAEEPQELNDLSRKISTLETEMQKNYTQMAEINEQTAWVGSSFSVEREQKNVDIKDLNNYIDAYDRSIKLLETVRNTRQAAEELLHADEAKARVDINEAQNELQKAKRFKSNTPADIAEAEKKLERANSVLEDALLAQNQIKQWQIENLSHEKSIMQKGAICHERTNSLLYISYMEGAKENLAYLEEKSGEYRKKFENKEYHLNDLEKIAAERKLKQVGYRKMLPAYVADLLPKDAHIKGIKTFGFGATNTKERMKKIADFLASPSTGESREIQGKKLKELFSKVNIVLSETQINNIFAKRAELLATEAKKPAEEHSKSRANITTQPSDSYSAMTQHVAEKTNARKEHDEPTPPSKTSTLNK